MRPEHAPFYRRVFGATKLSDARYYHGLSFPMVLYASDVPVIFREVLRRYPFFRATAEVVGNRETRAPVRGAHEVHADPFAGREEEQVAVAHVDHRADQRVIVRGAVVARTHRHADTQARLPFGNRCVIELLQRKPH